MLLRLRRVRVLQQALAIQLDAAGLADARPGPPRGDRTKATHRFAKSTGPAKARHKPGKAAAEPKWWDQKKTGGKAAGRGKTTRPKTRTPKG